MKTAAVICNVLFWAFLCMVLLTDGPPKGAEIWISLAAFLTPIFNVLVIRLLASPGHNLVFTALIVNVLWLGIAAWRIMAEYPSHPAEQGLIEFSVIMALTPIVSGLALLLRLRHAEEPVPAK